MSGLSKPDSSKRTGDEICELNAYIVLKKREKIDPTIDLEEVTE